MHYSLFDKPNLNFDVYFTLYVYKPSKLNFMDTWNSIGVEYDL